MTNLQKKLSENAKRIAQLEARREKLIKLNSYNGYTVMMHTELGLASNPRQEQYLGMLKRIHEEKVGLWIFNRENNKIYAQNLEVAKVSVANTMTKEMMFNLTSPAV